MISKEFTTELEFEQTVIDYLGKIGGVKQWEYKPEIKTTQQLWENFRDIINKNNFSALKRELSETEFGQIKRIIEKLDTPFKAGQFLYGMNGVSQVSILKDDGESVILTIFDQSQVGGGNTVYQVVNQIERPKIVDGKPNRRFDITLLINGLPIIQMELKNTMHSTKEALNQMHQYIVEKQYTGIYSTLQILIAMTPNDVRYMAASTAKQFNTAFSFNWQNEDDALPVRSWKSFADKVLSIPMAHDLATRYMILDGTRTKESIKVMRPYQVYATKRVIEKVRQYNFNFGDGRLGYIWHTTGSGKTITSFKTAWLASRLSNIHKVVFLVDRIALTNQTVDAYQAYDPESSSNVKSGVISETANISDLHNKLKGSGDKKIIVTSIQKMSRYVTRNSFKAIKQNILFIVDEAHRSTGNASDSDSMLNNIRKAFPNAAWIGYTGTPKFPITKEIFGELLHSYTIKEAIADKNVLGFNVEFKETIKAPDNPSEEDIDDNIKGSIYDTSPEHVELVVKDIFNNWNKRSNNRKYNGLFTVHVGGNKASTPRAMEYFDKFNEFNAKRAKEERLKVAISFSGDTSNGDNQLATNENLTRAIQQYNQLFGTVFDMATQKQYTEDITRRLNKSIDDGNYLDLVIVVDQLLTGFDAPELNTLYIDRTLKGANLIQAYSRTNRMHRLIDKPWGNVINYRWPVQNEYEMNKAFYIYSNRDSAAEQIELNLDDYIDSNKGAGIISKSLGELQKEIHEVVKKIGDLTNQFVAPPNSGGEQDEVLELTKTYSHLVSQIKQVSQDEQKEAIFIQENPDEYYNFVGISAKQEETLRFVIIEEIKKQRQNNLLIDTPQVDFEMIHIHEVRINYDYLIDLIAQMADEVHVNKMEKAEKTYRMIEKEIAKSESDIEKNQVKDFVDQIKNKEFTFSKYPAPRDVLLMNKEMVRSQNESNKKLITLFKRKWGLDHSIPSKTLEKIISKHRFGKEDMDKQNEINEILKLVHGDYTEIASEEIANLSWVKYRIEFRKAFYELADTIKKYEQ